jgi:hypothetical protein
VLPSRRVRSGRAAPYLRFSRTGVEVNQNSAMYYLNQAPVAGTPPPNLSPDTAPSWQRVSGGHDYGWHDGRLHALATVALVPGASYRWPPSPSPASAGAFMAGRPLASSS